MIVQNLLHHAHIGTFEVLPSPPSPRHPRLSFVETQKSNNAVNGFAEVKIWRLNGRGAHSPQHLNAISPVLSVTSNRGCFSLAPFAPRPLGTPLCKSAKLIVSLVLVMHSYMIDSRRIVGFRRLLYAA